MKWLRQNWHLATIALIIFYGLTFIASRVNDNGTSKANSSTTIQCDINANELLKQINTERLKLGSPILTQDNSLSISTKNKLEDMISLKYYGHNKVDGSDWSSFIRNQGVQAEASEDLNINALTVDNLWQSFKKSINHYQSLTNPKYTRVGISSQCVDFRLQQDTGPSDNTNLVNKPITDMTVVHLAGSEPQPASH